MRMRPNFYKKRPLVDLITLICVVGLFFTSPLSLQVIPEILLKMLDKEKGF